MDRTGREGEAGALSSALSESGPLWRGRRGPRCRGVRCTWASLIAQLVKSLPTMQETPVQFLDQEEGRRDRLPTPVFLGFLGGSNGKESACNAGDMGSTLG